MTSAACFKKVADIPYFVTGIRAGVFQRETNVEGLHMKPFADNQCVIRAEVLI